MPSHLHADHTAAQPPDPGKVDDLITQARRLRGQLDAVRRESAAAEGDPRGRWQRALCDLAVHQLDDLGHLPGEITDGQDHVGCRPDVQRSARLRGGERRAAAQ